MDDTNTTQAAQATKAKAKGIWWTGAFAVERTCTCAKTNRSAECSRGFHLVDSHDTAEAAGRDARALAKANRLDYRVVVAATGAIEFYACAESAAREIAAYEADIYKAKRNARVAKKGGLR